MRGDVLQRADRSIVPFNGNDSRGAERQQRAREPAGARTDFDHRDCFQRSCCARDPPGKIEIEQEILAERFSRAQSIAANNLAQRRQFIEWLFHGAVFGTAASAVATVDAASRAASRSAAIRLVGSALPVPAISKAVP